MTLSDEEHERRRQALESHDTISDAARTLGIDISTLRCWALRHYDRRKYLAKFAYRPTKETGYRGEGEAEEL